MRFFARNNMNENQTHINEIYEKLGEAEAHIEQGIPMIDSEEVFEKLKKKYKNSDGTRFYYE